LTTTTTTVPVADDSLLPKALHALAKPATKAKSAKATSSSIELTLLPYAASTIKPADPRPSPKAIINPRSYWVQLAKAFEKKIYVDAMKFLDGAPVDLIIEHLATTFPAKTASSMAISTIIARCGIASVDFFVRYATENLTDAISFFAAFDAPVVAPLVADARGKSKKAAAECDAWLLAHPEAAAIGLIPLFVGKGTAKKKRDAEAALRVIATHKQPLVLEVAQRYSDEVAALIAKMLGTEVIEPPKKASLPGFVDLETLPAVFVRERTHRLPLSAHERILFFIQQKDHPKETLAEIKNACDPASLAEFAFTLFERWVNDKLPSNGGWTITALGLFGDDHTALRLAPFVRRWPGESRSRRAGDGLDALAAINTDLAWTLIQDMVDQTPYASLRFTGSLRLRELATARGLGATDFDRLADRTVPRLPEQLKAVEPILIRRFERIMCTERRIDAQDFLEYFVRHPLLGHLVRTVVWMTSSKNQTFRVVEDLTFANEADDPFQLAPADVSVSLVHPADIGEDLVARWQKLFADYEIIQPFSQLERTVFRPEEEAVDAKEITRANDRTIATNRLYMLRRRGWRVDDPRDSYEPDSDRDPDDESGPPRIESLSKQLVRGGAAVLEINPGFYLGTSSDVDPTQTITRVRLTKSISEIGNVTYSELVTDLESLLGTQ
jgi:hypothetical protein